PVGLAKGGATAQQDLTDPTKLVSKPADELGNLPVISGGGAGLPSLPGLSAPNLLNSGANKPAGTSTPGAASPVKNFTDQVNDAVKKVTGGLGLDKKPAASTP
ncbi:MAG TPA: hypothetical protein VJR50_15615, partial [Mycobacterium sp.]|nr:hypothetical protein [Mycobacterium sp.]